MALAGKFYKSQNFGVEADDPIGGGIDTGSPLTGGLHTIFPPGVSDVLGGANWDRFQKVFWRNTGAEITGGKFYFNTSKYDGMFKAAIAHSLGDTGARFDTMPGGYVPSEFEDAVGLANAIGDETLVANTGDIAVWLWYRVIPGLEDADPAVPLDLRIAGVTL